MQFREGETHMSTHMSTHNSIGKIQGDVAEKPRDARLEQGNGAHLVSRSENR